LIDLKGGAIRSTFFVFTNGVRTFPFHFRRHSQVNKHPVSLSPKDIPAEKVRQLSLGKMASANLAEWLTVDFRVLIPQVFEELGFSDSIDLALLTINASKKQTVPALTTEVGAFLAQQPAALSTDFLAHPSDTVRCWGAYVVSADEKQDWKIALRAIEGYADDPHFGVREVAWMALRPRIISETLLVIDELKPWTLDERENIRRFAIESTRPRGVWCAHIASLKEKPEAAFKLLEPLFNDGSIYVRKSVGNWLNDAGKTRPDFVQKLIEEWRTKSDSKETMQIIKLASRNL